MNLPQVVLSALVLIGSGVAHGVHTRRWQPAADFSRVQARLDAVGRALGPWVSTDVPMSVDELDRVSIRAHLSRDYRNTRTGKRVRVLVVAGPPGPISVHTPDVCFQGTGYVQAAPQEAVAAGAGGGHVWAATFAKPGPVPTQLRVYWAWNGGAGWEAPDHRTARYRFAFEPILYKVYLVTEAGRTAGQQPPSAEELASVLLPELERAVSGQP